MLSIIFERESAVLAAPALSVMAPSLFFFGALMVINMSLEADGKAFVPMLSLAGGAAVKLALGLILINCTNLGILSAPIGTAASYFLSFLISYVYYRKVKFIKASPFRGIVKPLFISSLSLCFMLLIEKTFFANSGKRLDFLVLLSLYGAFYLLLSLIFSKKHKNNVTKHSNMHKKTSV